MDTVTFDKVWTIDTIDDYNTAMYILKEQKFLANMSDDFRVWRSETDEVERQMHAVNAQAQAKGLI